MPREGIRGRFGLWRAVVVTSDGDELLVRSLDLAEVIASALDAGPQDRLETAGSPRIRRYYAADTTKGRTVVVNDDRGRDRGLYRPGYVARTSSRELADRVVRALDALDPAVPKPPPRGVGIGWW